MKIQEEELDDLAAQVSTLESAKLRLEMQLEQMRKEFKRELQQREDEVEDVRSSAHKKVKGKQAAISCIFLNLKTDFFSFLTVFLTSF